MGESSRDVMKELKRSSAAVEFLARLVKEKPLGAIGGIITLLLLLTGIFADFLAPSGIVDINPAATFQAPSTQYFLGTDNLGRNMITRIIYGARISLIVGLAGTAISIIISLAIGTLCGYVGGKIDIIVQRFVDAWMCFPGIVLLILLMGLFGSGLWQVVFALGLLYGIAGSRVVRSAVIGIKENVYVDAAVAIGCPTRKLIIRHILPNIMAPIIILFTTRLPAIIMDEAALSFLGMGVPPPTPSWGGMLSIDSRRFMFRAPWMAIWPGLALAIVVYGVNMFGDAVRDILDPRLRGGIGRYSGVRTKRKGKGIQDRQKEQVVNN